MNIFDRVANLFGLLGPEVYEIEDQKELYEYIATKTDRPEEIKKTMEIVKRTKDERKAGQGGSKNKI